MIRPFTFFPSVSCIPHNLISRNELLQGTSLKEGQIPCEGDRGKMDRNLFFFFSWTGLLAIFPMPKQHGEPNSNL